MRRLTLGLVAVGLSALGAGCIKTQTTAGALPPKADQIITKEEPGPMRQPKPATSIAAGAWFESSGDTAKTPDRKRLCYDRAKLAYEQALETEPQNKAAL